ncbi:MAG: hypothetical protein N3F66_11875 [Spirochaetes bacterium]|nr:hypothetical protein [Spirochaetota bacterium]
MKRFLVCMVVLALACASTIAYANGIAQTSHFTAKHIAGMNDNTGDETAMYDPASTAWLKDGIYINVSNITAFEGIEAKAGGTTLKGETTAFVLPAVSFLYKQAQFAGFLYVNVLDGAPFTSLKWDDGTPLVNATLGVSLPGGPGVSGVSLEAESVTYNVTLGGSYKINDMFSVAVGGRYVMSETTSKWDGVVPLAGNAPANQKTTEKANGFGGVIGMNVVPAHGFLIGVTYATAVKREFEVDQKATHPVPAVKAGLEAEDGEKVREDLPAMATLTFAGMPVMGTVIALQINYMFNKQADWEGAEDEVDNDIVYMLALTQFLSKELRFSAGIMYADKGTNDKIVSPTGTDVNPALDELGFGIGGAYSINENLNVALTYSYTYFLEGELGSEKLNRTRNLVAVQVGYKL